MIHRKTFMDLQKKLPHLCGSLYVAGAEGFEPSTKVLETHVLPLHHAPNRNGEIIRNLNGFCQAKNALFGI